jgi:hypothetical protein
VSYPAVYPVDNLEPLSEPSPPFSFTRVRLQTAAPGTYTGIMDVVSKAIKADGMMGLYRGVLPPILGITPWVSGS